jgi:hypothetical protein
LEHLKAQNPERDCGHIGEGHVDQEIAIDGLKAIKAHQHIDVSWINILGVQWIRGWGAWVA